MDLAFGVFDHMDRGGFAVGELYANRLRLVEEYERAGFAAYHLAEHHGTSLGMAPSTSVFLSAVAQRTTRLRFGPMVYVLPVRDPLHLIEEICMLDQLSGGRFELGVGRGSSPFEIAYFGVNHLESRALFDESLAVLLAGLTGERVSYQGRYRRVNDYPIVVQPVQKPHPPLWYGLVRPEGAVWAAKNKVNVVVNGPLPRIAPLVARYRDEWRTAHGAAEPTTKIGLSRHVLVADTDAEAHITAKRAYNVWYKALDELWRAFGTESLHFPRGYDAAIAAGQLVCGAPDTVRARIEQDVRACGANYLVTRLSFGDMSVAEVLRSVNLMEREIMPAFGAPAKAAAE